MQRESEIRKVQMDCEKRLQEADRQMKLFEKQRQESELKDKELAQFRTMYRLYMNEQIRPPSQGDYNTEFRRDRDGL